MLSSVSGSDGHPKTILPPIAAAHSVLAVAAQLVEPSSIIMAKSRTDFATVIES
jgi:hypothetical protein